MYVLTSNHTQMYILVALVLPTYPTILSRKQSAWLASMGQNNPLFMFSFALFKQEKQVCCVLPFFFQEPHLDFLHVNCHI